MDEKKYAAFSIPRQEGQQAKEAPAPRQISFLEEIHPSNVPFAEIEYEPHASSAASTAPAQPIGPKTVDPIREKFFKMRSLASGIPFARNDPRLFYSQAKLMEDFSDDYAGSGGNTQFFMYYPCYQHMGYGQLRTYFTWRTKARRGFLLPTPLSYIFLYIYELLSGIGVKDPADGLDKLLALWNAYGEREQALSNYMPGWLKDYHIYYPLSHRFLDFIQEHNLQRHYLDLLLFDEDAQDRFAIFSAVSSYDIAKSKFYSAGNDGLMRDCFCAVLGGIQALCISHNGRFEDLLMDGTRGGVPWYPFHRAVFAPWLKQPDRQVKMPGQETYTLKGNRWTMDVPQLFPDRKELIGYLMKKTEACLRQAVGYKRKITANPSAFCNLPRKLRQLKISMAELDAVIEKSVADFHSNRNRTVVVVDRDNLNRIRKEALKTQDKLIVPEEALPGVPVVMPLTPCASPLMEELYETPASDFDGWAVLRDALTAAEGKALAMILHGNPAIKAFADQNGVMLEVLVDSINEKAADSVGDNIIESADSLLLYDEYKEKIAEMMG